MAYNLSKRFPSPPSYYRILDPGAYQKVNGPLTHVNKFPFLSSTRRLTQPGNKIWTEAIYNYYIPDKIINCTALKSKVPRFPYGFITKEDIEKLLCQCDIQNTCECSTSEDIEKEEIICQRYVPRHIFKGPPPRITAYSESKSVNKSVTTVEPPFYDSRVTESSSFYKGCKWSQRSSKRSNDMKTSGPGPAHYTFERKIRSETLCSERVRAFKRKTSKQLRFIEMVQQRNLRENLPGPGSYNPKEPNGTNLKFLGPKAERFITRRYEVYPGPSDHWVKRDFDLPEEPKKHCLAHLPSPAPFGSKAVRLKVKKEEGPSPATYNSKLGTCKIMRCSKAPFGISSLRFKEILEEEDDDQEKQSEIESSDKLSCSSPTWEFKSQTLRMKPLLKKFREPSPADLPQPYVRVTRPYQLQSVAPFFASDERFRPWHNWIPVQGSENTPGPCYYNLEPPKCFPAVRYGPLVHSPRFKTNKFQTPSPNEYRVGGGIENVLFTCKERLKRNKDKQLKFCWKTKKENKKMSFAEKENLLLKQSILLLNANV